MKKVIISALSFFALLAYASIYKLENVKRLEQDLYTTQYMYPNYLIKTRYCYHYTYGEDAYYDDISQKIIFSGNNVCEVAGIYKR